MSVSILDIELFCRVCLHENETNLSIFDEVQEFNMSISDLLVFYGEMTIDEKDIYPKIICDECLRELLIVAKFKEKVKLAENMFGQLIVSDDKVIDEQLTKVTQIDEYTVVKQEGEDEIDDGLEEEEKLAPEVTESYEEVEFLDGQNEMVQAVQFETIDKCDDEFIDEIIEECSVGESETIISDIVDNASSRSMVKKLSSKQAHQHLSPSDSKVIINFNCAFCGAGFMHSSNLKKHILTHRAEGSLDVNLNDSNDIIKIEEDTSVMEQQQQQTVTTGNASKKNVVKPHKCEYCDRAFVSRSLLSSHVRTHTGERPFACNQCDKNFATQGGLDLHTRRHLGLKNYVCNICDRRFVESSNLKVHMRTHTGERPHRCNRCDRSFSRVFLLQIHQRTHTGERPHQCPICFKGFAQQGDLSAHRRIHSGERPHQCPICFKGFIKSSALTSHLKRHNDKVGYETTTKSGP